MMAVNSGADYTTSTDKASREIHSLTFNIWAYKKCGRFSSTFDENGIKELYNFYKIVQWSVDPHPIELLSMLMTFWWTQEVYGALYTEKQLVYLLKS